MNDNTIVPISFLDKDKNECLDLGSSHTRKTFTLQCQLGTIPVTVGKIISYYQKSTTEWYGAITEAIIDKKYTNEPMYLFFLPETGYSYQTIELMDKKGLELTIKIEEAIEKPDGEDDVELKSPMNSEFNGFRKVNRDLLAESCNGIYFEKWSKSAITQLDSVGRWFK